MATTVEKLVQPHERAGLEDGHPSRDGAQPDQGRQGLRRSFRLAFLSFLMLFVELALIRWTVANNIHLAYLTNFVLLASFLGIGVGFLCAGSRHHFYRFAPLALAALVGFVLAFPVSLARLSGPHEIHGGFGMAPLPQGVTLPVIFGLSVAVMVCIGQGVARTFALFRPLDAYRLDILGSIAGIAAFSGLSFLELPPLAWGLVAALGFLVLLGGRLRWWQWGSLLLIVGLLAAESLAKHDHWSPYYKVTYARPAEAPRGLAVWANNIAHQTVYPVSTLHKLEPFYFYPYHHVNRSALNNVLIVGAGTGNDVAVALSQRAKHVDAVEIDPQLQRLGATYNPNHPYQNPRVSVHINDGRAYLQSTDKHYDLILFALPDSLTVLAGQSNLRLENYLFTVEAMREARAHLKPRGTFAMYNYYEPFLLDRYANTLKTAYGVPPCVELGSPLAARRQAVLTSARDGITRRCATPWHGQALAVATDDHPFPYLRTPSIPSFYLWTLGLVLLASLLIVRVVGGPFGAALPYLDLAFMGAGFLLLETKNVVQFALLFGTTWFVNSLVFAGILLSVYAAVEIARRVRLPGRGLLYAGLLASLVVAWAIPQESLLNLSVPLRFLAATAIAFAPVFMANLIFAQRFRDVGSSTTALGANLLGAMIGGVLEYLALISGYHFLLIVIAGLYSLALLFSLRPVARAAG